MCLPYVSGLADFVLLRAMCEADISDGWLKVEIGRVREILPDASEFRNTSGT